MAKRVVDITEKLSFDENPALCIRGEKIEVNDDAPTMLKVMGLMADGEPGVAEIMEAYNLVFPEESKEKIDKMKLSFKDLLVVIEEAIGLIKGDDESQGEQ